MLYYSGPSEKNPLIIGLDKFQVINPCETYFNFGSGNGWKNGWTDESIKYSVLDLMTYIHYKNSGKNVLWTAPHVTKGFEKWIQGSSNKRVLMEVTNWGDYIRGKFDISNKRCYLDTYIIAMKTILSSNPNIEGFYIKDLVKIITKHLKEVYFEDRWIDRLNIFLDDIVALKIPIIIEDNEASIIKDNKIYSYYIPIEKDLFNLKSKIIGWNKIATESGYEVWMATFKHPNTRFINYKLIINPSFADLGPYKKRCITKIKQFNKKFLYV